MDMCPVNSALKLRPEAFDGVRTAAVRRRVLPLVVTNGDVIEAEHIKAAVAAKFIGRHGSAGQNMRLHQRFHGRAVAARHNFRHHVPAALKHPDHNGLVALVSRPFAFDFAADQRFVNLDNLAHAAKRIGAVERSHVFADLMAHPPRGFVGHPKLALDFLGGNAVARRAEQEHDEKPVAQAGAGAIKRRSGGRVDLMAAIFANIGAAGGYPIVMRALAAARAIVTVAKAITHDVFKAAFLGRKLRLKLAERGGFRFHAHYVAQAAKCRKGIMAKRVKGDDEGELV